MAKFDKSVLEKYGITGTTEVVYNLHMKCCLKKKQKKA